MSGGNIRKHIPDRRNLHLQFGGGITFDRDTDILQDFSVRRCNSNQCTLILALRKTQVHTRRRSELGKIRLTGTYLLHAGCLRKRNPASAANNAWPLQKLREANRLGGNISIHLTLHLRNPLSFFRRKLLIESINQIQFSFSELIHGFPERVARRNRRWHFALLKQRNAVYHDFTELCRAVNERDASHLAGLRDDALPIQGDLHPTRSAIGQVERESRLLALFHILVIEIEYELRILA